MNSLTGKLGMRPGNDSYILNPNLPPTKKVSAAYEQVSEDPDIWKIEGPEARFRNGRWLAGQACSHVEWAAYITAAGRIEWHKQATAGSSLDLVAGDTDSVFTLDPRVLRIGNGLGEWQFKGRWTDGDWIAPKFYKRTQEGVDEPEFRSKGVRASRPSEWWDLWNRGRHEFEWASNLGFRLAAKAGTLFEETTIRREITRNTGDRILRADGLTYPPNARDLGLS